MMTVTQNESACVYENETENEPGNGTEIGNGKWE